MAPRVGVSERFYDEFPAQLPSLSRVIQRQAQARRRAGIDQVAAEWSDLLEDGGVANQSALACRMGVSRARVSQVLSHKGAGQRDQSERMRVGPGVHP